jgi:hypothetical protein
LPSISSFKSKDKTRETPNIPAQKSLHHGKPMRTPYHFVPPKKAQKDLFFRLSKPRRQISPEEYYANTSSSNLSKRSKTPPPPEVFDRLATPRKKEVPAPLLKSASAHSKKIDETTFKRLCTPKLYPVPGRHHEMLHTKKVAPPDPEKLSLLSRPKNWERLEARRIKRLAAARGVSTKVIIEEERLQKEQKNNSVSTLIEEQLNVKSAKGSISFLLEFDQDEESDHHSKISNVAQEKDQVGVESEVREDNYTEELSSKEEVISELTKDEKSSNDFVIQTRPSINSSSFVQQDSQKGDVYDSNENKDSLLEPTIFEPELKIEESGSIKDEANTVPGESLKREDSSTRLETENTDSVKIEQRDETFVGYDNKELDDENDSNEEEFAEEVLQNEDTYEQDSFVPTKFKPKE